MPYITHADVETFLNITLNSSGESTVDAIIPAVEAYAERYTNRTFSQTTQKTQLFDGGADTFFPSNVPIDLEEDVTVTIEGTAVDSTEIFVYPTYIKLGFLVGRGNRTVSITYTPAETLPADLKHALIRWTAEIFKSSEDAGKTIKRARVGDQVEMEFLTQDGVPAYVQNVLDAYRLPNL